MDNLYRKTNQQYWPLIDIAKLFCALLVVMIHCLEIKQGHPVATFIVQCFSGQAVPFFMIVSGFFAANKIDQEKSIRGMISFCLKKWLLPYFAWTVLWLPYYIKFYQGKYPNATLGYIFVALMRRILCAGQGVYWYLLVLAESVFIVFILVRCNKEKLIYAIGIIGLIGGILYDANVTVLGMGYINRIVYIVFSWSNNFLMRGIPYVAMGYFFRKNINCLYTNIWKLVCIYFISSACMIILYISAKYQLLCFYPIQAVSLFMLVYQPTYNNINRSLCRICREMSSAIYFLHTVFIYGIIDVVWGVDAFIPLKFCVAVFLSICVYAVARKFEIKPVKWLLGNR